MRRVEVSAVAKNAGDVGNLIFRESWEIHNADSPLTDQMVLSSRSEKILTIIKQRSEDIFYIYIFFLAGGGIFILFYFFLRVLNGLRKCLLYEINILIFNSTFNILQHYYNMNDSTPCHLI